ncbi:MAG: hemin uptake protein HemP [Planctomycetes bacterium]|nr:hemin uptake protein HemP [Planctomycetota bacterium]
MPGDAADTPHPAGGACIRSDDLLKGRDEVLLVHDGQIYRLRRTRSGKLILTK